MKIAFIRPHASSAGGFQMRLRQLEVMLERIAPEPLLVWTLPQTDSTNHRAFRAVRDLAATALHAWPSFTVRGLGDIRDEILTWIDQQGPTHVVLVHPFGLDLVPYLRSRNIKVFIDCHNVESDIARQLFHLTRPRWKRTRVLIHWHAVERWEKRYFPLADEVWVPSEVDAERLRTLCSGGIRVRCVPNALDFDMYGPFPETAPRDILLPAYFGYLPNIVGAEIVRNRVLPQVRVQVPDARLVLAGSDPYGLASALQRDPDVSVTGEVPEMHPYFRRAAVVVVPVLHGGGTRFKILEALALGRPVVSTPFGCEGLDVKDGEHLIVTDLDAFSEAIVSMLTDPERGRLLAMNGRKAIKAKYGWDVTEEILRGALLKHQSARSDPVSGASDTTPADVD